MILITMGAIMSIETFRAIVVREEAGRFVRRIETRSIDDLPDGDLLVKVKYSALNYKDALSATGYKGITRHYPHTPGIQASGVVVASRCESFKAGDEVIVAGFDLGMNTWGAFGEYIRVPADWAKRAPNGMTLRESMICGVAGFTAALSLHKLESTGLKPGTGPVLVTGATGGVGSLAIAVLTRAGYEVVAATGKKDKADYLRQLGASEVIPREQVDDTGERALLKQHWAGVVDTVGGSILATAIKSTRYGGSVTTCGLAQSAQLNMTVYPFILRAVNLLGIDSLHCPAEIRMLLWEKLAGGWKPATLETICTECSLEEIDEKIDRMLKGLGTGRTVIDLEK